MTLPLIPPYNISFSSIRAADLCERRAALMGPGAWQAWPGGARAGDPVAALCYRGKNLTGLLSFLGQCIHRVAERVVRAVAETGRSPGADALYEDVMHPMRALWLRTRRAFEQSPKLGYLESRYMGRVEDLAATEHVKTRARVGIRRLQHTPLLDDLRALDRADRLQTEELLSMPVQIEGLPPATFFGKADVVYIERHTLQTDIGLIAPGKDGIPVIVDFKTGRVRWEEAVLQHSLLALLLRANGVAPHPVAGYIGRVIDLSEHGAEDDRLVLIGRGELEVAEAWVRRGAARIAAMPRDHDGQVRLQDVVPSVGEHCRRCPMQRACLAVDDAAKGTRHAA